MTRPAVDPAEIQSFVSEARTYVPVIRELLSVYRRDRQAGEALEQAYRYVQSIAGAASMFGQRSLSRLMSDLERTLQTIRGGDRDYDDDTAASVERILDDVRLGLASFAALADRVRRRPADADTAEEDLAELREIFRVEAEEHLGDLSRLFGDLRDHPGDPGIFAEIRRRAHSLKGSAGTAGFSGVSLLAHRMEDYLDALLGREAIPDAEGAELLLRSVDAIQTLVGLDDEPEREAAILEDLAASWSATLGDGNGGSAPSTPAGKGRDTAGGSHNDGAPAAGPSFIRVPLDRHDRLLRLVGELSINRGALELRLDELAGEIEESDRITRRLERVSSWLEDEVEADLPLLGAPVVASPDDEEAPGDGETFDALEFDEYTETDLMSKLLSESAADLRTLAGDLRGILRHLQSSLNRETSLGRELEERLIATRMVRFGTLVPRLQRAVRLTAGPQDKAVELEISGRGVELDKAVIDALADPLLHLVRNAVDHGIEPRTERRAVGKSETGRVEIDVGLRGRRIEIQLRDDGRGLDLAAIRAAVRRRAASEPDLLAGSELDRLDDAELRRLIFLPGLSTAGRVDEISGRGIGLDAVQAAVLDLQGTIEVDSTPGAGTTFSVRLPMTLATDRVLLVRASERTYAIPQVFVDRIHPYSSDDLEDEAGERLLRIDDHPYPVQFLDTLLRRPSGEPRPAATALLIAGAGRPLAVAVDELIGSREVVVKSLGSHLERVRGVNGATLLGDGSLVLILNPVELTESTAFPGRAAAIPRPERRHRRSRLEVLVVDDSLSMRRALSDAVRHAGWTPVVARDGQEALEILQRAARKPDVILLDIEMPRMDGYDLAATLQGLEELRHIPIVMLTSRTGEKHRRRAFEVGARDYLIKPCQEDLLRETLSRVTSRIEDRPGMDSPVV